MKKQTQRLVLPLSLRLFLKQLLIPVLFYLALRILYKNSKRNALSRETMAEFEATVLPKNVARIGNQRTRGVPVATMLNDDSWSKDI